MSSNIYILSLPEDVWNCLLSATAETVDYRYIIFLSLSCRHIHLIVAAFETKRKEAFRKVTFGSLENDILPAISLNDAPKIEAWVSSDPETYRYEMKPGKLYTGLFSESYNRPKPSHVLAYACGFASHPAIFKALVQLKLSIKDPCIPELYSAYKNKTNIISSNKNDSSDAGGPDRRQLFRGYTSEDEYENDDDGGEGGRSRRINKELIVGNPWINIINLPIKKNESSDHYPEACGAFSALHIALEKQVHPRVFEILVKYPCVDVNRSVLGKGRGERPVSMAARSTSEHAPEYVRILLEAGANPNWGIVDGGLNALHYAMIYSPYSRVVELLVEHGAEINRTAYDYSGSVFYCFSRVEALHFGLKNPEIPIGSIQALLKAGASISQTSRCYNTEFLVTRLGLACWFMRDSRPDILELLIEHGAQPNEHIAASSPESFLTLNGGNYPKQETYSIVHNDTPLHYLYKSMWRRQPAQAVVDLLLKHGANMAARNHNGVSVVEVAKASARTSEHDDDDA